MNLNYYKKPKLPPQYTENFRDPEVWDMTKRIVGNSFLDSRVFRTWSAGCATGEEAYSLASILQGIFTGRKVYWKVYASDIQSVTVTKDNIRFKQHDLVADPPLPFMNLVFCRNVLMFFKKEYQEIICQNLYTSLRTGGYLVLGRAEQIPVGLDKNFAVVDNKLRIYQKN